MKRLALVAILLLTACDGNDNGKTPKFASAQIKGMAAMGVVSTGKVTAYDFSQCRKGAVLASVNLQQTNTFDLVLQPTGLEIPVLLELSDFIYKEEAGGAEVNAQGKALYSTFLLKAGVNQNAAISYWTHLAYARTAYLCKETPGGASQFIQQSNDLFKKSLAFDPIGVLPEPLVGETFIINNIDAMKYAVANAAVSYYTYTLDTLDGGSTPHVLYNSMTLADRGHDDLTHDGFLNGTGKTGQLYMGAVMVSNETYRTDVPNKINYVLAIKDIEPFSQNEEISIVAKAFNQSDMDIFSGTKAKPLGDFTAPVYKGAKVVPMCNGTGGNWGIEFFFEEPESIYTVDVNINAMCGVDGTTPCPVTAVRRIVKPNDAQGAYYFFPRSSIGGLDVFSLSVSAINISGARLDVRLTVQPAANCAITRAP